MIRKIKRKIKSLLDSGDLYFLIISVLLLPAIYFIIAGSDWPLWPCIPEKYAEILLEGDALLYDIGLAYAGGYIFYLLVDYLPTKRRIKMETDAFIQDMLQYMFIMSSAVVYELDMPSSFYLKLYNIPKEPSVFYKREKWENVLKVFYVNYRNIEGYYWSYRGYKDKGNAIDKAYLNHVTTKLDECGENYRICANRLSIDLGLHRKK